MISNDSQQTAGAELIQKAQQVAERLEAFYGRPDWREPLQPLDEMISTILSQNTNDRNRDLAFQSLKARFPSWDAVRDAESSQVVDAIRIAGLANQKGPRMQEVLRQITAERGSFDLFFLRDLPPEEVRSWLVRFKGVGPKTASIVMQFSLGMSAFPVDTHIYRVSGRLGLRPAKMSVEQAHEHLASLFSPDSYGPVHLNIIRLGREICQARRPNCPACPLKEICDYYQSVFLNQ
ncbi:MAG: endonuclease III [Anaerolineaceae bacterium]|nr:endonuclease III [Anaerolineaceae bacterium]